MPASAPALHVSEDPLRVVVAEDSFLFRAGIVRVLEQAGIVVAGEARDADELLAAVREQRPHVAVTDIRMPPTHSDEGVLAAGLIRGERPETGVLVLSQYVNESYALRLLGEGAAGVGYLLKQRVMEPVGFVDAVREVARGGCALDPEVVAQMLERRAPGGPLDRLTESERAALAAMAAGHSNPAIATALRISEAALQRQIASIFGKLELPQDASGNRRVLAVLAYLRAQDE
jgi:DNA-binding NarL/FixJ family response regulator